MVRKAKKRFTWFKAFIIAMLILLLIRFFVFQSFHILSSNMAGTLMPGDWVTVNKLEYGTRMPNTLLFIPFTERNDLSSKKYYLKWPQLPYYRLKGFSNPTHNDIIAFNYPEESDIPVDKRVVYIKRCVGLPGDEVQIRKNALFVNKHEVNIPETQYSYRVRCKTNHFDKILIDNNYLQEGGRINNSGEYLLYLTEQNAENIKKIKGVIEVKRENFAFNIYSSAFFPNSPYYKWTGNMFGPVYVPRKGDSIELGMNNIDLYKRIISVFEKHKLSVLNNKILIDNVESKYYKFAMNYYFVMDDNRDNAKDSRNWGFLPEDHIIGKINWVLFSVKKTDINIQIRWNRVFKMIE